MRRPHVIMLVSDQHRYDCTAHTGHPLVRTPHMDRLAREGVRFERCWTPIPVCAPARQTLVTGQWPVSHGGLCLYNLSEVSATMPPDAPFMPRLLRDAGYRTLFGGKWHCSDDLGPGDCGYETVIPDLEYQEQLDRQGLSARAYGPWTFPPTPPGRLDVPAELFHPIWLTRRVLEELRGSIDDGRPVFASIHTHEPHPPYLLPEPYFSMYQGEQIPPWDNFSDDLTGKPRVHRMMRRYWELDGADWPFWQQQVAAFLGAVSAVDDCLGLVLETLDDLGIAGDTAVIYTTDHGDLIGAHGMYDKHNVMYEEILRVPLIVRWPERIQPGGVRGDFALNCLDLPPTVLDMAGVAAPDTYEGVSLSHCLTDDDPLPRQHLHASYHGGQFGLNSQRAISDGRWKYVFNAMDVDELYDLESDPGELHNRIGEDASGETRRRLRLAMLEHGLTIRDPLFTNPWVRHAFETEGLLEAKSSNVTPT